MRIFIIEDDMHAENCGEYSSFDEALSELKKWASIPWGTHPNRCPCMSWRTCTRTYQILEYENDDIPYTFIEATPIFEISSNGILWEPDYEEDTKYA